MTIYRQPDNLPTLTYPLAVDASIQALQTELKDELGWLQYSFGRAYLGRDDIKGNKDYLYPAVYKGNGNYQDASPNDNLISQSFFFIDGDYEYENYDVNEVNLFTAPVSLIVWGNLKRIAPAVDQHFGQVLIQDTIRVIRKNADFKITKVTDNDPDVFREFTVREENTKLFYYPYFCFRINMDLAVRDECDTDVVDTLILYDIYDTPPTNGSYSNSLDATLDFTI